MSKYAEFDAKLLACIEEGRNTLARLAYKTPLIEMAKPFCVSARSIFQQPDPVCIIDRRLQALRKAGRIAYAGGKWHILNV